MLFPSPNSQSSIQTKNQPILLYKGCHSVIAPVQGFRLVGKIQEYTTEFSK